MAYLIPVVRVSLVRDGSVKSEEQGAEEPATVARIVSEYIGPTDRENFVVLLLNARNRIIGINTVSVGTLTASLVHPREVFKPAILASAAAIVLAHNHPSGDMRPSPEDIEATKRIKRAAEIIGIAVLDHVIIGGLDGAFFSFRQSGYL